MSSKHLIFYICIVITLVKAEDKWVWSSEHKQSVVSTGNAKITEARPILIDSSPSESESSRKIDEQILKLFDDDDYRKARYEVKEPIDYANGRPILPPRSKPYVRPISKHPNPNFPSYSDGSYPDRPSLESDRYPTPLSPSPPLSPRPGPDEYSISGNSPTPVRRQPPAGSPSIGILTGPIPSWEKPVLNKNGDPTNFEHCKCSFSFNCKSPGIQFGSCDQGKTYCCYNEFNSPKEPPIQPNGFGTSNIERFDKIPPVLIGPGGPSRPLEGYRPFEPSYEDVDGNRAPLDYERNHQSVYPIIPNKPILPPYMGLHNDYRSSK